MDEQEKVRQNLWCATVVAYVSASNSTNRNDAARWADKVLEDFDARFKNVKTN